MAPRNDHSMNPIAVVGVSCRLPGKANDLDKVWEVLSEGTETWSPVPQDRYNEAAFYHPNPDNPNGTTNHRGGHFIDSNLHDFDHTFFRLSAQQASCMDPQQRMLLEMSYEAFENAGLPREVYQGSDAAVFVAMFTTDFDRNMYKDPLDLPVHYLLGTEEAVLANRISHVFDLHGPSMTLDTGCSGGLYGLHQACQSLRYGESHTALVAAANLTLSPEHHIGMSNLHLLSDSGRCYPFDVRGDGYGRGEGLVVLILKSLEEAIRDRDPVRAVIRSTAVNQDGYTAVSITHPNGSSQANLIRTAYSRVGLRPSDVLYVEAHGTGTIAGDHEELSAITEVFNTEERIYPLYVGASKGSFGHTENTSGLVSVLKSILLFEKQMIPPVAGFSVPKPGLPLHKVIVPTELIPWPHMNGVIPRVSINSFGFGGANSHAILEASPNKAQGFCHVPPKGPLLFVFSANSRLSLSSTIEKFHFWVQHHPRASILDISYTLCQRRSRLPFRFSCVADHRELLLENLSRGQHRIISSTPSTPSTGIVFIYTGQGAQWVRMGRELLCGPSSLPIFRDSIRSSSQILQALGATWDLEYELLRDSSNPTLLNTAEVAQPATTALQSVVIGHSSGEISAAYAAGFISHSDALAIAFHRGFMAATSRNKGLFEGGMMSVGLGETEIVPYLEGLKQGTARVACINSPSNVTVSGDRDAVMEVAARLDCSGNTIFHRHLKVDTAYHSHHMEAVADEYRTRLESAAIGETTSGDRKITFISSVTGRAKSSQFGVEYWVENLVRPVRFFHSIKTLSNRHGHTGRAGHITLIEIGPHHTLAGPVRQCFADSTVKDISYDSYAVLKRDSNAAWSSLELAGRLFERGVDVDMKAVSSLIPGSDAAIVSTELPPYSWDRSVKHWHESRLDREYRFRRDPYHDLLGVRVVDSTSLEPRWRHMVDLVTIPWLADHIIDDLVIFPASGYICMAVEATRQLRRERFPERALEYLVLRNVSFVRGLIIPNAPHRIELQLSFRKLDLLPLAFAFSVTSLSEGEWVENCNGVIEGVLTSASQGTVLSGESSFIDEVTLPNGITMTAAELYAQLAGQGNVYKPSFAAVHSFTISENGREAVARVEIPDIASLMPKKHQEPHLIHPTTLDAILHTSLPLVDSALGLGSTMPVHIGEMIIEAGLGLPRLPGSKLEVMTALTFAKHRTAIADLRVAANNCSVLSMTSAEMRSLGEHPSKPDINSISRQPCYEMRWSQDINHLRVEDLGTMPTFDQLIIHFCFKMSNFSVAEYTSHESLRQSFLSSVTAHAGSLASYFVIDTNKELQYHRGAQQWAKGIAHDATALRSADQSYDIVLASTIESLDGAASLTNPGGFLIAVLSSSTKVPLHLQLSFYDAGMRKKVILAKPIQVLTHSDLNSLSPWTTELIGILHSLGDNLTLSSLNVEAVVLDDQAQPVLSCKSHFELAMSLLQSSASVIWISQDDDPAMHQITGVARSAHAENDNIHLTTIHVAKAICQQARLLGLIESCIEGTAKSDEEREHRVCADGTILIPRLWPSRDISRAVVGGDSPPEIENTVFADDSTPFTVVIDNSHHLQDHFFIQDVDAFTKSLGPEEIRIRTHSMALLRSHVALSVGVYVGSVIRIGSSVNSFNPGDVVAALGSTNIFSHPSLPQSHATLLPAGLAPEKAAALLLSTMAAQHSLYKLANLCSSSTVLIHGALSVNGRATVACARAVRAHVTVTANDITEKSLIIDQLDIQPSDVYVLRPSLAPRSQSTVLKAGFDVIIQADESSLPTDLLSSLKPTGSFIFIDSSKARKHLSPMRYIEMPPNTVYHHCDIEDLIARRPDTVANLMSRVSDLMTSIPSRGLQINTYNIEKFPEVARLLSVAGSPIIVEIPIGTTIPIITRYKLATDVWRAEDASYIVSGGLGDLGRRLLMLMASRGAKSLVTLSRRAVDEDTYHTLQAQLQAIMPDCRLTCLQCDITSETSLRNVLQALSRLTLPPVRGIIQCAVVLRDRTLEKLTYDEFSLVTSVKVGGTLALYRAFASHGLDFFIMLSSAANIIGTSGQASYNAGNAVQDIMAQCQDNSTCHFMSLDIGWVEDAVATADHDTRVSAVRRAGLKAIPHGELERFFNFILGASAKQRKLRQIVIGFDSDSISKSIAKNGNVRSPMFCHVRGASSSTKHADTAPADSLAFKTAALVGDPKTKVNYIANAIAAKVAQLISVEVSQIDTVHGSVLSFGLDSLVAIELRNWIMREFNAPLQTSELIVDQPLQIIAEKIATRSHRNADKDPTIDKNEEAARLSYSALQLNSGDPITSTRTVVPLPRLENTLQQFEESRQAFDSDTELHDTAEAVRDFLEGIGPNLQLRLQNLAPEVIAEMYDRAIYLDRRDPLQNYNVFSLVHPLGLPPVSQAMRAAVLTAAVYDFAQKLASAEASLGTMHGTRIDDTARHWMFYCTRQPGLNHDSIKAYHANDTIVVLRRGHIFKVQFPRSGSPLALEALYPTFEEILRLSEEPINPLCILTSDERDSWFTLRCQLEEDVNNADVLNMVDSAAFLVCLDDESPLTAGDRHMQFLLNGRTRLFANRWLDKSLQFAVTANGVSASIFNHTVMDGLDARALHTHISESLYAHARSGVADHCWSTSSQTYPVREYFITPSAAILKRIDMLYNQPPSYGPIDLAHVSIPSSGSAFFRRQHVQPNATTHVTVLLALFHVDRFIRPAWEIASLGHFWRGRIDWMQTITPAMRAFLEAVAEVSASPGDGSDLKIYRNRNDLRTLLTTAINTHAKSISATAQGQGFVRHLYLLRAAIADSRPENMPKLFQTRAWDHTRRDGLSQDLKIGFMPNEDDASDDSKMKWVEGGFLMMGDRGVYIQCRVDKNSSHFVVSAAPSYAAQVCESLQRAAKIIETVLGCCSL
ncbi:polyketide synthase [Xylaria sp. FL1042]|nr:polyketide synthase [Xylaria sp. FL1042]